MAALLWKTVKLGDVFKTGAGGTPFTNTKQFYENGDISWLLSGAVCQKEITISNTYITQMGLENSSAKIFPPNTLLVAMYGATAGQVGILRFPSATNQAVCGIYPSEDYLPEFLYYYLLNYKEILLEEVRGVAQPNLSQTKIKNIPIPLAPLTVQRKIVEKLDAAFAEIDTAMRATQKNIENTQALSGKHHDNILSNQDFLRKKLLKHELKGEAALGWKTVKLAEIVDVSMGKTPSRSNAKLWDKEKKTDNVWLSIADLTALNGFYVDDSKEYVSDAGAKLFREVPANTLIMSFKLSIGKLAITSRNLRTNEAIAAFVIKDCSIITNQYLLYYLSSLNWERLAGNDVKVKGKTLNKAKLKELPIVLPPIPVQRKIVEKLDNISRETEKMKEKYYLRTENLIALKSSILSQAFSGELTKEAT